MLWSRASLSAAHILFEPWEIWPKHPALGLRAGIAQRVLVFLRVLEYYSGIFILTTNRVGILDETFESRVHISLYYPEMDRNQTLKIFENNIKRLEAIEAAETDKTQAITVDTADIMRWAANHFAENAELGRWNGRQIRNAFQTAASLAHYDALNPKEAHANVKPESLGTTRGRIANRQLRNMRSCPRRTRSHREDTTRGHTLNTQQRPPEAQPHGNQGAPGGHDTRLYGQSPAAQYVASSPGSHAYGQQPQSPQQFGSGEQARWDAPRG